MCEACNRTVRFENGAMVPIRVITCTNCGAEQRVSVKAERMVCDRCNMTLHLQPQEPAAAAYQPAQPTPPRAASLLGDPNQNVSIVALDHTRENQIALILQREMSVDLQEARRLLSTISEKSPLIVAYDAPYGEADGLRRQLEQLGVRVTMRATAVAR